jgi:SAM-dependent methyltransferase
MTQPYNPETYWDRVANNINSRKDLKIIAGDDEPYYRYKRNRFLSLLDKIDFTGKTVLEIGSGPGGNLNYIFNKGCRKVTGVDISKEMVSLSKELLNGRDIEILKMDGKTLPFPAESFDIVFTSSVLQHNTNEEMLHQLLKEICRVAKKDILLFERIENRILGHESNLGRPVSYYESILERNHFKLLGTQPLLIQASYFVCGVIRKVFNRRHRNEGEPLSRFSIALEKLTLPVTSLLDRVVPSNRDVMLLKFTRSV